jgi:hypothetical protein
MNDVSSGVERMTLVADRSFVSPTVYRNFEANLNYDEPMTGMRANGTERESVGCGSFSIVMTPHTFTFIQPFVAQRDDIL